MDILYNTSIHTQSGPQSLVPTVPGKREPHNDDKTHAPCYEAVGRGNQVVGRLHPNPDPSSKFEVLPT